MNHYRALIPFITMAIVILLYSFCTQQTVREARHQPPASEDTEQRLSETMSGEGVHIIAPNGATAIIRKEVAKEMGLSHGEKLSFPRFMDVIGRDLERRIQIADSLKQISDQLRRQLNIDEAAIADAPPEIWILFVVIVFILFRRSRKKQSDDAGKTVHGPPGKNQKQRQADARSQRMPENLGRALRKSKSRRK